MYIIQNTVTNEIQLTSNIKVIEYITKISINKLYYVFSNKKQTEFYYLQYKIYKRNSIKSSHI